MRSVLGAGPLFTSNKESRKPCPPPGPLRESQVQASLSTPLYLTPRQENSTSPVTWEGQKQRGLHRARREHILSCNVPPQGQTEWRQDGCPRYRTLPIIVQWVEILKRFLETETIPEKDCERPATNTPPAQSHSPGDFTDPRKRVIFKFLQGLDSCLSWPQLCLTRY